MKNFEKRLYRVSYLCCDAGKDDPKSEDIPVIREFPDIFLEKLLGVPPEREIEFEINLIPSAEPISKNL